MLSTAAFLQGLQTHGLSLSTRVVENTIRLVLAGDEQVIARKPGIRKYIKEHREELIEVLSRDNTAVPVSQDDGDGIPRCYSCGIALAEVDFGRTWLVDERRIVDADGVLDLLSSSTTWGEAFCMQCWHARTPSTTEQEATVQHADIDDGCIMRMVPAGMSPSEYIDAWYAAQKQANTNQRGAVAASSVQRCSKHGKLYTHSDEYGGQYCSHVDCWDRYRLMQLGAHAGYPALDCVIDCRDHLPDTSKEPLRYTEPDCPSGATYPVYPCKPVVSKHLVDAGPEAWRVFVQTSHFIAIDQAVKTVLAMQLENVLPTT